VAGARVTAGVGVGVEHAPNSRTVRIANTRIS
jgi:hypothetical protein